MVKDACRIIDENQRLNEELHHCTEVVRINFDVIAQLESKNKTLKGELENGTSPISTARSDVNVDCRTEIEQLQQNLNEKDEMIEKLMAELTRLKSMPSSHNSNSNEVSTPAHASDSSESFTVDLLDASGRMKSKIRDLEKIATDIETNLNEQQDKLLEQQTRIDEFLKQKEAQSKTSNTVAGTDEESAKIDGIQSNGNEDREKILAQQLAHFEDQIDILMKERGKLMKINNDLMKSISVCQKALCPYTFEQA